MRYHYLSTWTDRGAGQIRARMFAPDLGVPEDEATDRRGGQPDRVTCWWARRASISRSKSAADSKERYTEANRR